MKAASLLVLALGLLTTTAIVGAADAITLTDLLAEMVDRDALARWPAPAYTCRQASSYDRHADTPGGPTWWANMDRSWFLRTEQTDGRREHVLLDAPGPGALVRFWATWHGPGGGPFSNGTLRVYLDGAATPEIEGPIADVLDRGLLTGPPLSQGVSPATEYRRRGHNLYLPIPYGAHCKVTYETDAPIDDGAREGEALYYQINYRTYEPATAVRSYRRGDLERPALRRVLDAVQRRLAESERPGGAAVGHRLRGTWNLDPGATESLRVDGPRALRCLRVRLEADDPAQALRSTVLHLRFDGRETVWCPVGDFFGTGYRLSPHATWTTETAEDGTLSCYWTMPFARAAVVGLENLGSQSVRVTAEVLAGPWDWDANSLTFHADWRQWHRIETQSNAQARDRGALDLTWLRATGRGVYVGDHLTLFNGAAAWWGEGDEKIFVDDETFPSHFGTGSEDYYGYAWSNPNPFAAPFHAQPVGEGANQPGLVVNVRHRALDAIPFERSLRFDMELWHWAKTRVNVAPVCFWYGDAGARSEGGAEPAEARRPVARRQEDVVPVRRVAGAIEGEDLRIAKVTGGTTERQSVAQFNWSGNRQLWWKDGKVGDELQLVVPVPRAGRYEVVAALVRAPDYGRVRLAINGRSLPPDLDLYHTEVVTGEQTLGTVDLRAGDNTLCVTIQGANPQAIPRHMVGIDYLLLRAR